MGVIERNRNRRHRRFEAPDRKAQGEDRMNSIVNTRKGEVVQVPPLVQRLTSHPLAA